jgi:hypothetical protein
MNFNAESHESNSETPKPETERGRWPSIAETPESVYFVRLESDRFATDLEKGL